MTDKEDSDTASGSRPPPAKKARITPTEVKYTQAEKEVAMAMDTFDYDEVIDLASKALHPKPSRMNETVTKARKNILLSRCRAYDYQGLGELALEDARDALQLDPDDPVADIRIAVLLIDAKQLAEAERHLKRAATLSRKLQTSEKTTLLRHIGKLRQKLSDDFVPPLTDRLPNEVLIEIALHLQTEERKAMSQTCTRWREILVSTPSLWTTVHFKMPFKRLHEDRCAEWLEHISSCANRSNNTLESVTFALEFPDVLLEDVLLLLQPSASTLSHIAMPTERQRICYELLYRCCPKLKHLNMRVGRRDLVSVVSRHVRNHVSTLEATKAAEQPFSLEVLEYGYRYSGPPFNMLPHVPSLRILREWDPWDLIPDGKLTASQYMQFLSTFASNVEEWTNPRHGFRRVRLLDSTADPWPPEMAFPRLVKLGHFVPDGALKMTCPRLLETTIFMHDDRFHHPLNDRHNDRRGQDCVRFLRSSPLLQKLWIAYDTGESQDSVLEPALRELHNVKEFGFRSYDTPIRNRVSKFLRPKAKGADGREFSLEYPFPKLRQLNIGGKEVDKDELVLVLIAREQLRLGKDLHEANRIAAERLTSLKETYVESSNAHSQQGRTTSETVQISEHESGLRLAREEADRCRPLKTLKLERIKELPAYIQPALESIGVKLIYTYDRN